MNTTTKKQHLVFPILALLAVYLLIGCGKYKELADTDFPDQVIYMPTASTDGAPYEITKSPDTSEDTWQVPTPGSPYRFRVDASANKIIVPLGVVRGGKDKVGSININIVNRPDTVNAMIGRGLAAQPLPQSAYTLPSSATIADGKNSVTFDVAIDRTFLVGNPGQAYAIGVHITSSDRAINTDKQTTVVLIKTDIFN
ncbi:MAG TPA: DUF1735 domain-containing protein [Sphingobacterium sp.]|nr:DUF1735 domain-containing protein [Sphingobacterium sp.]